MTRKAVKKVGNSVEGIKKLEEATTELGILTFHPTDEHRRAKARFWTKMQSAPFGSRPETMGPDECSRVVGIPALRNWWQKAGFKDWFLNNTEHTEKLEYLYDLALNAVEDILRNTDPKAQNARINAIKAVSELARKMPSRQQTVVLDRDISKMSEEQLREYIAKQSSHVDVEPLQIEEDSEK